MSAVTRAAAVAFLLGCADPHVPEPVPEPAPVQAAAPEPTSALPALHVEPLDCPIEKWSDGYWVPAPEVHTESCECYKIRAKLNGERGDCGK